MNKILRFSGYCPTQGKEYQIPITYVGNSPLSKESYEKGTSDCDYVRNGGQCNCQCPIQESAPHRI